MRGGVAAETILVYIASMAAPEGRETGLRVLENLAARSSDLELLARCSVSVSYAVTYRSSRQPSSATFGSGSWLLGIPVDLATD